MVGTAVSKNGASVRLTDERWSHIIEEYCELAGYRLEVLEAVRDPESIRAGGGELLAVRPIESEKWLVVVYRETGSDGFIITAFLTRRKRSLERRTPIWPP